MGELTPGSKNVKTNFAFAKQFISALPLQWGFGMELQSWMRGLWITLRYDERLVGDPRTGVLHWRRGIACMDTCCGAGRMTRPRLATPRHGNITCEIETCGRLCRRSAITARRMLSLTRVGRFCACHSSGRRRRQPVHATGSFTV